ncbi:MAG: PQQ-binding-like beta-propeller repeat protein [Chloroflexi bacterium]|nr:PQQ-binding-like beta-propeller repeat protein [Chloroflexota bacterium]
MPVVKAAAESLRWLLLAEGYGHPLDPVQAALAGVATMNVGRLDWPQWGGWSGRNNTPSGKSIPSSWDIGRFNEETGAWIKGTGRHIKWVAKLGSQSYGTPVIAGGRVFIGTNNGAGYVKRFGADVDLGCLLCFRESDGAFLWQHSNRKLRTGRVNDWPMQGVCSTSYVSGNRLWYVSNRCEVVCLDVEGFHDGENDGPFDAEESKAKDEADVVWKFDMIGRLGVYPHNMSYCSVTCAGDILFVNTSNGVDNGHVQIPRVKAPSFIALDRNTGKLLWKDSSPGEFVLHGQWSSPACAVLGGVPQVLFAGGDGWLYSFHARSYSGGKPKPLWKFDCNPKSSKWLLEGRGTRNQIVATPVIYRGLIYLAVGQDPEHGEGVGHLWCIDPTRRGDVSPTLAVDARGKPLPRRRLQLVDAKRGERAIANPNSAVIWHYTGVDLDGDGKLDDFKELMHRSISTVAIKNNLLIAVDFSGLVHCLDARTGKRHWTYDMLSDCWSSPLIVDGKVYVADAEGDVAVFGLSADPKVAMKAGKPLQTVNMGSAVYATPIVANNVLYVTARSRLFAIQQKPAAEVPEAARADGLGRVKP